MCQVSGVRFANISRKHTTGPNIQDVNYNLRLHYGGYLVHKQKLFGDRLYWFYEGNVRHSCGVALRRIKLSNSFYCVAGLICSIHELFELD